MSENFLSGKEEAAVRFLTDVCKQKRAKKKEQLVLLPKIARTQNTTQARFTLNLRHASHETASLPFSTDNLAATLESSTVEPACKVNVLSKESWADLISGL